MSERHKMEADLAAKELEARDLEYKVERLRDAMRDQLYPMTAVRDLKLSLVATLAAEAEVIQGDYHKLLGQIGALRLALGK
jgi:hypothetical protein